MIVLLNCSMNLFGSNANDSSTGELASDSVLIAYDDLRIVNSKLVELKYEKEINSKLRQTIHNDSIIYSNVSQLNDKLNKDYKKVSKQRTIFGSVALAAIVSTIVLLIK